jgi:hypothetical protein
LDAGKQIFEYLLAKIEEFSIVMMNKHDVWINVCSIIEGGAEPWTRDKQKLTR